MEMGVVIDFAKAFVRLNNNKNSNMALYPVNIYELAALSDTLSWIPVCLYQHIPVVLL